MADTRLDESRTAPSDKMVERILLLVAACVATAAAVGGVGGSRGRNLLRLVVVGGVDRHDCFRLFAFLSLSLSLSLSHTHTHRVL